MITKIVLLFLIGMAVLAMFGKLTVPGSKYVNRVRCKRCGRFRIGKGPCPCKRKAG